MYDVGFSVNAYLPGRFPLTSVAEIPGEITDAETGSVALWRTYENYFESAGEYNGLQLLALFVHGPGQLHTKFPVNSLEDLKGKNITMEDVISATDYITSAIEIVGSRIKDWNIKITDTIADNASSSHFILGTKKANVQEIDLENNKMFNSELLNIALCKFPNVTFKGRIIYFLNF